MAQNRKELNVSINNGDTIINGKNIKGLSPAERKDVLKDIEQLNKDGKGMKTITMFRHKNSGDKDEEILVEHMGPDADHMLMKHGFNLKMDSTNKHLRAQIFADGDEDMHPPFKMDAPGRGEGEAYRYEFNTRDRMLRGPNRRNTQSFSYSNTNNDGISTHVSFSVGDVNRENLKRISGAEKADLQINDLTLTPAFSTGKTNLSFALTEKGAADVQFKDSEGKVLWSDKASSTFYKSFALPQNGIYYLQVKQNGKLCLRRIVKEQ